MERKRPEKGAGLRRAGSRTVGLKDRKKGSRTARWNKKKHRWEQTEESARKRGMRRRIVRFRYKKKK